MHADYIRAGASVVIANTFSTDRLRLGDAGLGDRVEEVNRKAVQAALEARRMTERPDVVVAGSLSRAAASVVGGGSRGVGRAALLDVYTEQAGILADAGVDLIALEMMSALEHAEPAFEAARSTGLPIWLGLSADHQDGRLNGWQSPDQPFDDLVAAFSSAEVDAMLVMHTDVDAVDEALESVFRHWDVPVGVYPHVGTFEPPNWRFDETFTPDALVANAQRWVERGVRIVGGCCGLGPAYIRALSAEFG